MQSQSNQNQSLDPSIVNLAKAISKTETGGSSTPYSAQGASGEYGAYQYTAPTWAADSVKYLGTNVPLNQATPAQQDEVAYKKIQDLGKQGYKPSQIASIWNSGKSDPTGNVGTNKEGVAYDTPKYVKAVGDAYSQLQGGNQNPTTEQTASTVPGGGTPNYAGLGAFTPPSTQPAPLAPTAADTQTQPQAPEGLGGKAVDVAKGITNFLFPIAGDLYHDVTGSNKKTLLQQAGDAGLSALPFVPGLGEVGDAARAADAGAEATGLLGKIGASTAAKGALAGYGAGVSSNLSQGKSIGQSLSPNASTIGGIVLGGATPAILKGASGLLDHISGLSPQMREALSHVDPQEQEAYLQAAKDRSGNVRAPTPQTMAADQLDTAAQKISKARAAAGAAVGATKEAVGAKPLGDISDIIQGFNKQVEDKYGLTLTMNDGKVIAQPLLGRARAVPASVTDRITTMANQLLNLRGGSLREASDVASNFNDLIDRSKQDVYGHTNDPLEGLLNSTDGQIRQRINDTSPEMAQANANFSGLKDLEGEIQGMAGKNLQKGELLMRRVFSGDKSGDVQDLFGKIKAVTGIDLVNHAVMAKHAIDVAGDESQKTLLSQAIEGGIAAHTGGIISGALNLGKGLLRHTIANPEAAGRRAIAGKSSSLTNGLLTKAALEGSRLIK